MDFKRAYRTILGDRFPAEMTIRLGDVELKYRKRTWKIVDVDTREETRLGLRYGENPDQEAALYELVDGNLVLSDCRFIGPSRSLVSGLREEDLLQFGKHPGKINLTDLDSALNILKHLGATPAAAVMKHNNPSGVAKAPSIAEAVEKAYMADRIAAMGGCIAANRPLDRQAAEFIASKYVEVVAAPEFEEGAVEALRRRKNLRIVRMRQMERLEAWRDLRFVDFHSLIDGGIIIQQSAINRIRTRDDLKPAVAIHDGVEYRPVREPTPREFDDIIFGWNVEQGV
ncbi:MAG: IMP cyclohydrolase, partial [Planctomycetes bacterium]|nr:IMP cyclohydrolase [Planctomycetota bacterium]